MNPIESVRAWLTFRRRVRKVAVARAEISTFSDQIRRLGDCPGFLFGVGDEEAHLRLMLLLRRADDRISAYSVALEIYGREAVEIVAEAFAKDRQWRSGRL